MTDVAIRVEHLGKRYRIGRQERTNSFREALVHAATAPWRRLRGETEHETTFWALRDVSFEVKQGEVVGIIGRNGAGKSTLLKILTRITEPTEGRITTYGRVASLLEVGTGFHPELTGRENVFMNGAILGMTRREIERKFDEIVAFAEVEKFLDTPVKRYSSGMYVRLAFAVAAHLEPEILLVDEVLAVGDAQFQEKCLGKMGEVARGGRTVLFVSHNMGAVQKLCTAGMLLEEGRLRLSAGIRKVTESYVSKVCSSEVCLEDQVVKHASIDQRNGAITLTVDYEFPHPVMLPCLGFIISDSYGQPLFGTNPKWDGTPQPDAPTKAGRVQVRIDQPRLCNGSYRASLWFGDGVTDMFIGRDLLSFVVDDHDVSQKHDPGTNGAVYPRCEWLFS